MDEVKEPVQEENPILESHALPSGSRGDEGILEGVAITDNLEETYSSESDEGEEGIIIHAGRTTSQKRAPRKSFGKSFNNYTRPDALSPQHPTSGSSSNQGNASAASSNVDEELKKLRFLRHATAFDVDINALEDHPWRSKTVDLLDYFNYGFNERTWMQYCEKQLRLRSQKGLGPYVAPAASTISGSSAAAMPLPPVASGPPGFIPPQFQTAPFVPQVSPLAPPQTFTAPPPAPPSLAQFQAPAVPAPIFEVPPPVMAKPAMAPPAQSTAATLQAPPAAPVAPPTAPAGMHQGFMPPPPLPGGRPGPPSGAFANPNSAQATHMGAMAPPGPPQPPQAPAAPPGAPTVPITPHGPQGGPPGAFPPHPNNFMGFNQMNHMDMGQGNMFMQGHMGMQGNFMGHNVHPGMGAMGMHGLNRPGFDMYGREIGGNDRGNDWNNDYSNDKGTNERVGRDPTASLEDRFAGPDRDRDRDRDRAGRDPRYEGHRDRRDVSEEQSGKRKHASNEDLEGSSKRRASSRDRDDRGRGEGRDSRVSESKSGRDGRDRRDSRDRDEGRLSRRSSSRDRDRDRREGHSGSSKRGDKDRDRERERSERPSDRSSGKDRERSPDRRARR